MKLGFVIPIVGPAVSSAGGLSAFCRGLEDLGYDTLWVGDRLVTPVNMQSTYPGREQPYPPQMTRYLDPVLLGTVAAAATSRVRLNASTLSTFYYEPTHLARQLTMLDVLSDGRLDVGVGVGSAALAPAEAPQDSLDHLWSIARRAALDAGRDPDALRTAMRINLEPGMSVDSVVDKLERFSTGGVDEAIMDAFALFPSLEQLLDFAGEVITTRRNPCNA